ncbi:hypothetical protein ACI789_00410 [Geodermatophilus sp. SYSU D00965]
MGAAESNAGDDFHFWWAASRALALIEPGTHSRLLVVEGLSVVDDADDQYETVDLAEYFAGEDFDDATAVVLSQLKYSTRHPAQAWTVSRLCEKRRATGSTGTPRSVIADLAAAFRPLVEAHGRELVLKKLKIQLVSNQPGDPTLLASVAAAAEWAWSQPSAARRDALLRALPPKQAEVIRALSRAVGSRLTSSEFCDFMAVLDLTQTGALHRAALARSVRASASELTAGRGSDSARRLFELVRREAMPEAQRRGLRDVDVLAELGVGDAQDLYPAPPRLPDVPDPLPTPGAAAIARAVLEHPGWIIVAHGPAGTGKTTALRQVPERLPRGSTFVLFDCYGGGEYLSSGEERHTPHRFVVQLINDLAQRCGTPLLLQPPRLEEELWRYLSRTLNRAVATLDPDALLVIGVDAADNAAIAADERGDRGFLPGLLRLPLPPRVAVVLTARTHRIDTTGAGSAPRVEVCPFDADASARHLRRRRPEASDDDAAVFHARTGGNPRTQFYALAEADADGRDVPALLKACRRTPEALFEDLLDSALQGRATAATGQRWLALMLALARPVSMDVLAAALDVDVDAVTAFAGGLTPGVEVIDGAIQFRDEDFEAYVRDRVDPTDVMAAHGRLAELFLDRRDRDADAAAHVADHLFDAGRLDEVIELVLAEGEPRGIADGFRREQVQGRRLDLAARAAGERGDAAAAVRIAARGCDTASRVDTLSRLVETHLDLVARYADVELLRAYALRQSRDPWLGPLLMRLAAALARDPERHPSARSTMEAVEAWLHRWAAGRDDETRHWDVDDDDVAAGAEAVYRLDGTDAAIAWLRRWRPVTLILDAVEGLAERLAGEIDLEDAREFLRVHRVPRRAQAPILAHVSHPTAQPAGGAAWLDEVIPALLAADAGRPRPWHTRLLDAALRHGDRRTAAALARHWSRELPASRWAFATPDAEGVSILRCHAAAAALSGQDLATDGLVPAVLRPEVRDDGQDHDPRSRDRAEWLDPVAPLARTAELAARAVAGDAVTDRVADLVEHELVRRLETAGHRWFTYDRSFRTWAALAAEAVADAGAPERLLHKIVDAAPRLLRDGAPQSWLDLAEVLVVRGMHTALAAELCLRAATRARTDVYSAPDRLELLARAAEVAGRIDATLGRQIFDQTVDAATGVNDDAAQLLSVHADLADRAAVPATERTRLANALIRVAERVAPHVTDSAVMPYAAIAHAAARLDAGVGLAAASRWDDEARAALAAILPAALTGAVDGGAVPAAHALALDHLVERDEVRLDYQLGLVARLATVGAAGTAAARVALVRASRWLRHHVPAALQPQFAGQLLDAADDGGLGGAVRAELAPVCALTRPDEQVDGDSDRPARTWLGGDVPPAAQALLDAPGTRGWSTLADDVAALAEAHVAAEPLRSFVEAVTGAVPVGERLDALTAVAALPGRPGVDTAVPVLADLVDRWRDWPGVSAWAADALPGFLGRFLTELAWRHDPGTLLHQLRRIANDTTVRRAVLAALPTARPHLTAHGWRTIAAVLGGLCAPAEAATALAGLFADAADDADDAVEVTGGVGAAGGPGPEPVVMLLWSACGHPRRQIRWRAAHAVRELLTTADAGAVDALTAALVGCLDLSDPGPYRSRDLHFYQLSALAAMLTALARVAADRPALLRPHAPTLVRLATSRDLPHAQIRELARSAALAIGGHPTADDGELRFTNRPIGCLLGRRHSQPWGDRQMSDDRRYRFEPLDTIPYWYAPLARVFDVPVDDVAERAERWILDRWGLSEDDWWTDTRDLRDERSWNRTNHRHGSIPPEENLRLYLEYHAMLAAAGELVDAGRPALVDQWDDGDPWQEWLEQHLPLASGLWLADLRSPVPVEPGLFGQLPALDEWDDPTDGEFDHALGLDDGHLPERVIVAGGTDISRSGAYGDVSIRSALVGPDHAADLQRALAAASDPMDWKLPDEAEDEFEVDHGPFVLRGWLAPARDGRHTMDEHDPYAHELRPSRPLPGHRFRDAVGATPDATGLALLNPAGAEVARAEQWADDDAVDDDRPSSAGYRVRVDRGTLLQHLTDTGTSLIVEVRIGRHRRNRDLDDYRPSRSRIYLIDAAGDITVR